MNENSERLTFPEFLGLGPKVAGLGEPDGNEGSTYSEGDEETETGTEGNLDAHPADEQLLGSCRVLVGVGQLWLAVESLIALVVCDGDGGDGVVGVVVYDLLDETEEDGDDDGGLEGLAEDDEEDGDGEDVSRHRVASVGGRSRGRLGRHLGAKMPQGSTVKYAAGRRDGTGGSGGKDGEWFHVI